MKRLDGFAGGLAAAATAALAIAIVTGGGGCELMVGDALPDYDCLAGATDPCPSGLTCIDHRCAAPTSVCGTGCASGTQCDSRTSRCVVVMSNEGGTPEPDHDAEAGTMRAPDGESAEGADGRGGQEAALTDSNEVEENAIAEAGDVQTDSHPDSIGPCRGVTCTCSSPADCQSGICAGELTVTKPVYLANNSTTFCTQPCCTSADCSGSTVCFATGAGAGGNYCVDPSWIGRSATLGTAIGGTTCQSDSDCRSGLCASGACADTCCSTLQQASECAAGTTCRFSSFPGKAFDTHYTASCSTPGGTVAGGGLCTSDTQCLSARCAMPSLHCEAVCRSSMGCPNGEACLYTAGPASTSDIAAGCVIVGGAGAQGTTCSGNGDCQSDFCDGTVCSDVCFADSDCTVSGWHCRPENIKISTGGVYSVLVCGTL